MNITLLEKLTAIYPEHILINFSDSDLRTAESLSENYSNQTGKNYAYINKLITTTFINYLRENLLTENEPIKVNLPETWEFVNGSAITIELKNEEDNTSKSSVKKVKKLILIPTDTIDIEEFTVPQEWVDIPNWAGDYYLPVQVDLEKNYLHIWGYISRQTLKIKAEYNPTFRNYYVKQNDVISDLDLLWVAMAICEEKGEINLLPELAPNLAENLITKLSKVTRYSPRLDVDFQQWASLLNNQESVKKLHLQRVNSVIIDLQKWLNEQFDQAIEFGWLAVSEILLPKNPLYAPLFVESPVITKKVKQAKLINLPVESKPKSVVMVLEVTAKNNGTYGFSLQIRPYQSQFLPSDLNFTLYLKSGETLQSITAKPNTNYIKSKSFSFDQGDQFSIKVSLENMIINESFCI